MDGRGRIAQSLSQFARLRERPPFGGGASRPHVSPQDFLGPHDGSDLRRLLRHCWSRLIHVKIPSGIGVTAAMIFIVSGIGYGLAKGGHLPVIVGVLEDARDQAANAVGFGIADLRVSGHNQLTREEVLAAALVTGRSSLLFLDADATRERLKANAWIADATVRKMLPGQLQIEIKEREPFALWQKDQRVSVIADDGTMLEGFVAPQLLTLPLVVGQGAETRAKDFLTQLDRYPAIRDQVRAAVLVGERRWNLRLRSGLDIRLPESNIAGALDLLVTLDRDAKLLTRDIVVIDMRLPDRVTVRLSEQAAQAREEQVRELIKKSKKGGRV
jgi:cell division protein FtsQ